MRSGDAQGKSLAEIHEGLAELPIFRMAVRRAKDVLLDIENLKILADVVDWGGHEATFALEFSYETKFGQYAFKTNAIVRPVTHAEWQRLSDVTLEDVEESVKRERVNVYPRVIAEYLIQDEYGFVLKKKMQWPCSRCGSRDQEGYIELAYHPTRLFTDYSLFISLLHVKECTITHPVFP